MIGQFTTKEIKVANKQKKVQEPKICNLKQ